MKRKLLLITFTNVVTAEVGNLFTNIFIFKVLVLSDKVSFRETAVLIYNIL